MTNSFLQIFLFQSSTKLSYYPDIWKRSIVPVHKIIDKQLTENYNYLTSINQILAITHEIFQVFDRNPTLEVRSVL